MALILSIDTATEKGCVQISANGKSIAAEYNLLQKDHASWIHAAIAKLFSQSGLSLQDIEAISVVAGPGSYTGIRVGMSTAKGFCFTLKIPLIILNSLEVMAHAAVAYYADPVNPEGQPVFVPMIDARRMEVFAAVYDANGQESLVPGAYILTESSFSEVLARHSAVFFGSGSAKFKLICQHPNARFIDISYDAHALGALSEEKYLGEDFADLAYSEPLYLKEFYTAPAGPASQNIRE